MYDALLNFPSAAAARNDPVLSRHMDQLQAWQGSYVLPDVKAWRPSQDHSIGPDPMDPSIPMIAHTYRAGWNLVISLPQIVPALLNHPNLIVMIDRDAALANRTGMIVKANVSQAAMQDTRWEPVFAGCDYPWGNWK